MPTKREVIERLVKEGLAWAVKDELIAKEHLQKMLSEYKVTTDKIVAYIERFFLAPAEAGLLEQYVRSELQKTRVLLATQVDETTFGQANARTAKTYAEKPVSDEQVKQGVARLQQIIDIMASGGAKRLKKS